jgi:hypothetical protein
VTSKGFGTRDQEKHSTTPTNNMKILALIATKEDPMVAVNSLKDQTIPPTDIVCICGSMEVCNDLLVEKACHALYLKPEGKDLGTRITKALNYGIKMFPPQNYEYLLKVDADNFLPKNFIEGNLPKPYEIGYGDSSILFVSTNDFQRVLNGKWAELNNDDTYTFYKFEMAGFAPRQFNPEPKPMREWGGRHDWRYFYNTGLGKYELGLGFLMTSLSALTYAYRYRNLMWLFRILGCAHGIVWRLPKYDIADYVYEKKGRVTLSDLYRYLSKLTRMGKSYDPAGKI